jgi:Ras-related protein Rab-5C
MGDDPKVIQLKIVLVGNTGTGKTCIIRRAISGIFNASSPSTLGASYATKNVNYEGHFFKLQIWDTAGQEKYRAMAPMYYRGAHVALVVYSVADAGSFESTSTWIDSLNDSATEPITILLIANKIDLQEERVVSKQGGELKARETKSRYYEVSAKTGEGIDDLFGEIPVAYLDAGVVPVALDDGKLLAAGKPAGSGGCC